MDEPDNDVTIETTTDLTTPEPQAPPTIETPPAPTQEDLWEVKVGGKSYKVPRSEVVAGYQRQQDYTQKTMKLSEAQRAWEEERQGHYAKLEELKAWLQSPENIKAYLQQLTQQRGYESPDVPLTAAQAEQLVQAKLAQERASFQQQLTKSQEEMEQKAQAQAYLSEINKHIEGLLVTHPELATVEGINALLYKDVAAMQPESYEEAKQMFAQAAKNRADKIRAYFVDQQKLAAVKGEKLKQGIEPPGGAVPTTPQPKYKKVTDPDLMKAVIADLMAAEKEEV